MNIIFSNFELNKWCPSLNFQFDFIVLLIFDLMLNMFHELIVIIIRKKEFIFLFLVKALDSFVIINFVSASVSIAIVPNTSIVIACCVRNVCNVLVILADSNICFLQNLQVLQVCAC